MKGERNGSRNRNRFGDRKRSGVCERKGVILKEPS